MRRLTILFACVLLADGCQLLVTNDDLVLPAGADASASSDAAPAAPDGAALAQDSGLPDAGAAADGAADVLPDAAGSGPDAEAPGPDAATQAWCAFGGDAGGAVVADGSVLVDVTGDPLNCGACGHACGTSLAKSVGCADSTCRWTCLGAMGHCGADDSSGCDTDLSKTSNCGACGVVCGNAFTQSVSCDAVGDAGVRACNIVCATGRAHCSSDPSVGCEATTASDPRNCGRCGYSCDNLPCSNGLCLITSTNTNQSSQIVMDETDVYWANPTDKIVYAASRKQSTGFRAVSQAATSFGLSGLAAVDSVYVYFAADSNSTTQIYRVVKTSTGDVPYALCSGQITGTGSASVLKIDAIAAVDGAVYFSGDSALWNATYTFYVQPGCGSGGATGIIGAMTSFAASSPYMFVAYHNGTYHSRVQFIDTSVSSTALNDLAILSGSTQDGSFGPHGVATDGTNVYWRTDDGNLNQASRTNPGATFQHAINASGWSGMVTDGTNLYFGANNSIYKVPVAEFTQPGESLLLTSPNYLQQVVGVDGANIVFSTSIGSGVYIWRTAK